MTTSMRLRVGHRAGVDVLDTPHNHHSRWVPVLDVNGFAVYDDAGEKVLRHVEGAEGCPVCAKHDHTDTTIFGWTVTAQRGAKPNKVSGDHLIREHREPVPAWHFTCEACHELAHGDPGSLEGVALTCDLWSPEGARFRRANPERFPGQIPMLIEGDEF